MYNGAKYCAICVNARICRRSNTRQLMTRLLLCWRARRPWLRPCALRQRKKRNKNAALLSLSTIQEAFQQTLMHNRLRQPPFSVAHIGIGHVSQKVHPFFKAVSKYACAQTRKLHSCISMHALTDLIHESDIIKPRTIAFAGAVCMGSRRFRRRSWRWWGSGILRRRIRKLFYGTWIKPLWHRGWRTLRVVRLVLLKDKPLLQRIQIQETHPDGIDSRVFLQNQVLHAGECRTRKIRNRRTALRYILNIRRHKHALLQDQKSARMMFSIFLLVALLHLIRAQGGTQPRFLYILQTCIQSHSVVFSAVLIPECLAWRAGWKKYLVPCLGFFQMLVRSFISSQCSAGKTTAHEATRAAENVVRVAGDAASAARPLLKGALGLRHKLEFLKKSLDAVEAAGATIRGETPKLVPVPVATAQKLRICLEFSELPLQFGCGRSSKTIQVSIQLRLPSQLLRFRLSKPYLLLVEVQPGAYLYLSRSRLFHLPGTNINIRDRVFLSSRCAMILRLNRTSPALVSPMSLILQDRIWSWHPKETPLKHHRIRPQLHSVLLLQWKQPEKYYHHAECRTKSETPVSFPSSTLTCAPLQLRTASPATAATLTTTTASPSFDGSGAAETANVGDKRLRLPGGCRREQTPHVFSDCCHMQPTLVSGSWDAIRKT
eukprot:284817494_4